MPILLWVLGTLAATSAPPVCSVAALPVFRDPAATYLVGTATTDTARSTPGGQPIRLPGLASGPREPTFGQLLLVAEVFGSDSARLEQAFTRRGRREALVVPWSYGPGCQPIPWQGSARWAPVGPPGAYRLHLRPEAEWAGGPPVFDALRAELQPYPLGLLARPPSEPEALTPAEFTALYASLPTDTDARERRAAAQRALDAWERAHPELAQRFPAVAILRNARATIASMPSR